MYIEHDTRTQLRIQRKINKIDLHYDLKQQSSSKPHNLRFYRRCIKPSDHIVHRPMSF